MRKALKRLGRWLTGRHLLKQGAMGWDRERQELCTIEFLDQRRCLVRYQHGELGWVPRDEIERA